MPFQLSPDPQTLGIAAPYLGRWFTTDVTLPAPAAGSRLGLVFPLQGNDWRPPATGFFSLFIADPQKPPAPLATLRDAKGNHPFDTAGQVIATFTLLPEVEARLRDLLRQVPALGSGSQQPPAAAPTRLSIRTFALALPATATDLSTVFGYIPGIPSSLSDEEKANYLGFGLVAATSSSLINSLHPMSQLRRPGRFALPGGVIPAEEDLILTGITGNVTLWAFDARGRAVDPGAVAAWFSYLVTQSQLGTTTTKEALAFGGTTGWPTVGQEHRVCLTAGARVIHLTDAHEGVLGAPFVGSGGRLQLNNAAVTDTVLVAGTATAFSFTAAPNNPSAPPFNPAVDNAPQPRIAQLPDGTYDATVDPWPQGQQVVAGLERDFVRIAVVDVERHLVGIERADSPQNQSTVLDTRRKEDQNRPSTRTSVAVCTVPLTEDMLLATAEPAAAHFTHAATQGPTPRLVVGVADGQGGPLPSPLTTPTNATDLPTNITESQSDPPAVGTFIVRPLVGCHAINPSTQAVVTQQVLLELKVDAGLAGSWVRAWPLGFDFDRGEHFRMDGGGGLVGQDGTARLVMELPDQITTGPNAIPSFDMMIIGRRPDESLRRRTYGDRRYHRPAAATGNLADTIDATMTWYVCETGQTGTGTPSAVVAPGATLVVKRGNELTLATRGKIPAGALVADTLMRSLVSGAILTLTQPALKATPDRIDDRGRLVPSGSNTSIPGGITDPTRTGITIDRTGRPGRGGSRIPPSVPFPTQERMEMAASWVESNDSHAAVGSAGMLARAHELLPHDAGHPGSAAGVETHGTGVRLQGAAAVLAAEYVLDRTAGLGQPPPNPFGSVADLWVRSELALAYDGSRTAFPAQTPTTPARRWAAVLKTNARGMEGLPGAGAAALAVPSLYPLSVAESRLVDWLNRLNIPGVNNPGDTLRNQLGTNRESMLRLLDRRIKTANEGAREAGHSLRAAFDRAQDFIYLETPLLDNHKSGETSDQLDVFDRLKQRLTSVPGLRVIVCLPAQIYPGLPKSLADVVDDEITRAVKDLRAVDRERVAVFSPGAGAGRSVRMASTTVIIDDAYALTGTTHLSRRGLTFDSSLAVAAFDERLNNGRPQEITRFRRALLAARLGIAVLLVPDDPAELVRAIRDFDRTGSFRLARHVIQPPAPLQPNSTYPTDADRAAWNPDGSLPGLTLDILLALFAAATGSPQGSINDPL